MKKRIIVFIWVLSRLLTLPAAEYGILVNSTTYYAGKQVDDNDGFTQYLAHVNIQNGDFFQLCDPFNDARWAVALDNYSVKGFTYDATNNRYRSAVSGCYDFYIKLKYEADELYIGPGSDCGEGIDISGQGGGQGGEGGEDEDVNYYAIGWINGADHGEAAYDTYEDEYLFVDGKLTINCQMGSYIAIKDHMGNFYYSKTETTIANESVTMEWANGWQGCQKWAIPEGVNYIIIRSAAYKNKLVLERVDKATYDAYHYNTQGIEKTGVNEKAHKVIIDGQLRIVRGDKIFDATGRQL